MQNENTNENFISGIIGAILGSLVGVLIWVILSKIGIIAAIAGAAIALGAIFGYQKLAGGLSKNGLIPIIVVVIIMVYFSVHLSWSLDVHSALKENGINYSLSSCFFDLYDLLDLAEVKGKFIIDIVLGYALTIVGTLGISKKFM